MICLNLCSYRTKVYYLRGFSESISPTYFYFLKNKTKRFKMINDSSLISDDLIEIMQYALQNCTQVWSWGSISQFASLSYLTRFKASACYQWESIVHQNKRHTKCKAMWVCRTEVRNYYRLLIGNENNFMGFFIHLMKMNLQ